MSFNFFTTDQYLGLIRHLLTVAGGALVAKGVVSDQVLNDVIGAVMTLIGFGWSMLIHAAPEVIIDEAKKTLDNNPSPPPAK
jgi:hypothetical protein